jgi:hypothetical protein
MRVGPYLALASLVLTLAGCGGGETEESHQATAKIGVDADQSQHASTSKATRSCPGTLPTRAVRPVFTAAGFNYGGTHLRVHLYWPRGRLTAGIRPGGGAMAIINRDGSISAKLGWWLGVPGKLVIRGRRLDASAPPLRADVPDGYGSRGFQATRLTFSTVGCWQVIGKVGRARLSFVVKVTTVRRRVG